MSVNSMLAAARNSVGLGEPNHIQSWYAGRNGSAYRYNFPWCDASISYWAHISGNYEAVCPNGDRAYTVWHAQDFQRAGRWTPGTWENTRRARPGDIVFFDWGRSNSISAIDHVGIVERNLGGGRLQTIEGNSGNRCRRRVRTAGTIAGFGRPAYSQTTTDSGDELTFVLRAGDHRIMELEPGESYSCRFDAIYDGEITEDGYYSFFPDSGPHIMTMDGYVRGGPGQRVRLAITKYERDSNEMVGDWLYEERLTTGGTNRCVLTGVKALYDDAKYRMRVYNMSDRPIQCGPFYLDLVR